MGVPFGGRAGSPHGASAGRWLLAVLGLTLLASCASLGPRRGGEALVPIATNTPATALPQTAVASLVLDHLDKATGHPKALVLGLDGTRPDALWAAGLGAFLEDHLPGARFRYAFAGGPPSAGARQRTMTLVGFTTILTGQWATVHGINRNWVVTKRPEVKTFPSVFLARHPEGKAAVLAAWEAIVNDATYGDSGFYRFVPGEGYYRGNYEEKDPAVVAEATRCIAEGYDLVFAVIDRDDHNGHLHGFTPDSPAYVGAIRESLLDLGTLLAAIKARAATGEDWLVVVTTDHGGLGNDHGGQSDEERSIFILDWEGAAADVTKM